MSTTNKENIEKFQNLVENEPNSITLTLNGKNRPNFERSDLGMDSNFKENSHLLNTDPDGANSMPLKENISSKRQSKLTPKALEYKLEENNHRLLSMLKTFKLTCKN